MSRWKVKKCRDGGCPDWHVYDPHGEFHGPSDWQDALAYADRAARTVEVTLPRVDKATLLGVAMDFPYMAGVNMSNQEAESLGLTLLALARRKEQT